MIGRQELDNCSVYKYNKHIRVNLWRFISYGYQGCQIWGFFPGRRRAV